MNEFYVGLAEIFEVEPDSISADLLLDDVAWDSLAMVSTIALFDEVYGKEIKVDKLKACRTVGDLEQLAQ